MTALAIPARAARARARVGDARIIAGDPYLGLEKACSAAAALCVAESGRKVETEAPPQREIIAF